MAVTLPGDIVLDVTRAVSLDEVAAARARLASKSSAAPTVDFAREVDLPSPQAGSASSEQTPEAFRKFEAMMLQSFIQSMLPKENEAVYGEGMAGEMWRSMLAEQIAKVMADRGGIGVADRILKEYYRDGDAMVAPTGIETKESGEARAERTLVAQTIMHQAQRMASQPALDLAGDFNDYGR